MSKVMFILSFFVTTIALAGTSKLIECSTADGKVRYEGIENLVTRDGVTHYEHDGSFFLSHTQSDRNYVVGEFTRGNNVIDERTFLAKANILVVDETESGIQTRGATVPMLCSYILNRN